MPSPVETCVAQSVVRSVELANLRQFFLVPLDITTAQHDSPASTCLVTTVSSGESTACSELCRWVCSELADTIPCNGSHAWPIKLEDWIARVRLRTTVPTIFAEMVILICQHTFLCCLAFSTIIQAVIHFQSRLARLLQFSVVILGTTITHYNSTATASPKTTVCLREGARPRKIS